MTYFANTRFADQFIEGCWYMVDTETNYINVSRIIPYHFLNISQNILEYNLEKNKQELTEFIKKNKRNFKQYESLNNLENITSNDSAIYDYFINNKTTLYYYLNNNQYKYLDYDIFEGFYVHPKILHYFIKYFKDCGYLIF